MRIDDLFRYIYNSRYGRSFHKGYHGNASGPGEIHRLNRHFPGSSLLELIRSLLRILLHRKALVAGAVIIGAMVLVSGITLIWVLISLVGHAAAYVDTNGLKGVIESVMPYLERLWSGNG
jgi:hypothetical protein